MKNNYLLINLFIFTIGLVFIKLNLPGGSAIFILSIVILIIVNFYKLIVKKEAFPGSKLISIEYFIYLIYTLIGILFRHQFWFFPFWYILFRYIWPIFSLMIITHLIIIIGTRFKTITEKYKKSLIKEFIIPLLVIIIIAVPTFFTRTEKFVKIFKSYTYEELMNRWNNEKK